MSFSYITEVRALSFPGLTLQIEQLRSLDETIDQCFVEYERTGKDELFADLCPYFGVPWPSGVALAQFVMGRATDWRGLSVLELGCGLALPSLVLAALGLRTTACDLHPDVPIFLERNKSANGLTAPTFLFWDWRKEEASREFSILLASDVLYDRLASAEWVAFLLRQRGWREMIFVDPGRPYLQKFVRSLRAAGFQVVEGVQGEVFLLQVFPRV